ncbi:BREX-2 system phosphatase PglZ [Streptomyces sp. H27-D2]|uniref:BREX-2 system phosphatase PglZ n=1 Tax=Streptomyces sp. H27-D2 TaxID=3046304 RepID=UPI002DB59215|nr:BREX-2 system phosphatase PglZ [Streptomyces sp. H27-D2]MEC4014962.1 BREX-2 system phosphatase PglZ [Streptomyces sp. H27-D2]
MPAAPPQVSRRTIEALLNTYSSGLRDRRLVLVHGSYQATGVQEFTAQIGGEPRRVRVSDETSVLGIVDAWQRHRARTDGGNDLLVVTTGVDDAQLGWDLRGHAVRRRTLTVENSEIVKQRFGASELDPQLYREPWLLEALLDAEPAENGWQRVGSVLARDTAMRALLVARLGLGRATSGNAASERDVAIDADALFAWSRTPAGPARFQELGATERAELKSWLGETAGAAVPVLMSLAEAGNGADAMALGLLGSVLGDPEASADVVLAVGGLFGQVMPRRTDLKVFAETVEGTLTRWIGEAQSNETTRQQVISVLDRADRLAADAGLTEGLRTSRFLLSSFTAQLRMIGAALSRSPEAAEAALADLRDHALARLQRDRVVPAEMAVRVLRWLSAEPRPRVHSVPAGVRTHLADWGWVDRALNVLWAGDPVRDPAVGQYYRALYEVARARRDALDEEFAGRLASWTRTASAPSPGGCLLVENVLAEVAQPLSGQGAPLVLLLDGMSSAAAVQIGEEAERKGWTEAVPAPAGDEAPRRLAAVSMLPSVTEISRASLLTGRAVKGKQPVESAGFAEFWKQRRHPGGGVLFHKAAIEGVAGYRLSEDLVAALSSAAAVGVVLNTIDYALDHGQEGERTTWQIEDVTYLRELLDAAKAYNRPVLIVADHGHVLERGVSGGPVRAEGANSARWRTGAPGDGEVELAGPRVLEGGGTITAPWREDIRYTSRKAGYHGGAALAEVTVPLLVLLASPGSLPKGWRALPREQATPPWWQAPASASAPAPEPAYEQPLPGPAGKPTGGKKPAPQSAGLFEETAIASADPAAPPPAPRTLGASIVASEVYEAQKAYVRKAPDGMVVAAVIDALADADGTMSPAALAAAVSATGRVRRNIDGFIATVQRLLNVEGYPVLGFIDAGHTVKLDVRLLRTQFQLEKTA